MNKLLSLLVILSIVGQALSLDLASQLNIYTPVSAFPCTTLVSNEGPIGCTSSRNGDYAPLWPVYSDQDIHDFANVDESKIVVMGASIFTRANVEILLQTKKVAGILVGSGNAPNFFSPVSKSPNDKFGLNANSKYPWNSKGDDFSSQYYSIPMFALDFNTPGSQGPVVEQKAKDNKANGGKYPQHGAWLKSFMQTPLKPEVCVRRGLCAPVGGRSVWGGHLPVDTKPKIFVTSAMDSNAFFHDVAFGASAEISSTIAILLAAEALSAIDHSSLNKSIYYGLFGGESYGLVGSRKFSTDLMHFTCNTKSESGNACQDPVAESLEFQKFGIDTISDFIEVSQIGNLNNFTQLFIHQQTPDATTSLVNSMNAVAAAMSDVAVSMRSNSGPHGTPPGLAPTGPATSFIKAKAEMDAKTVVLAGYDVEFTDSYYHSRFDAYETVNPVAITHVATYLARTLYTLATLNAPNQTILNSFNISTSTAEQLLFCLTKNLTSCPLAARYLEGATGIASIPTGYTSVFNPYVLLNPSTKFIHDYLFDKIAYKKGKSCTSAPTDCVNEAPTSDAACMQGQCVYSATYYHAAVSLSVADSSLTNEPSFYESNWAEISVKVFTMESIIVEIVVLLVGVAVLVLSFLGVFFLRKAIAKRFKIM